MASRALNPDEQALARRVFSASLILSQVEISDGLGFGNRPWTLCGTSVYTIHLGPAGFEDALQDDDLKNTLIHELTHCWQGQNSRLGFGFMIGSICCQTQAYLTQPRYEPKNTVFKIVPSAASAYAYSPGKDWTDYNCEQQAQIVEDWFARGMSTSDPRYRYVRDNIRKGNAGNADAVPGSAEAAMQIDGPRTLAEGQSGHYTARPIGLPAGGTYEWWPKVGEKLNGLEAVQLSYGELTVRAERSSGKAVITVRYRHPGGEHVGRVEILLAPGR